MILDVPITAERIILRSLTDLDVGQRYLDWMSDREILKYLEVRFAPPQTVQALKDFVTRANDSGDEMLLGIFLRGSLRHIGNIKLGPICGNHNRADLGFIIGDRDVWGRGYATEAISAVANFAFSELAIAKVSAGCYASNRGSARALIKAGFVQEGMLRSHWSVDGRREDGLLFGRMAGDGVSK